MKKNKNESDDTRSLKETFEASAKNIRKTFSTTTNNVRSVVAKSKDSIVNTVDANGNGEIDIEDLIILGLQAPGIKVNRNDFLQRELMKNYPQEVINVAITHNLPVLRSHLRKLIRSLMK